MRLKIANRISRRSYALFLTAALLVPGISSAAIVSGEVTASGGTAGDITLGVTVDDIIARFTITWAENRWAGISFGPTPAHDGGYMIIAKLDGTADEYNARTDHTGRPIKQAPPDQDLTVESFTTGGGVSEIVLSRLSNTGDFNDFWFEAVEQFIPTQWSIGWEGDLEIDAGHEVRGYFDPDLHLVPVPAAMPLLVSGLFALGLIARRKKTA